MRSSVVISHVRALLFTELDVVALRPAANGAKRPLHLARDVPRREFKGGKPRKLLVVLPGPGVTGVAAGVPDGAGGPGLIPIACPTEVEGEHVDERRPQDHGAAGADGNAANPLPAPAHGDPEPEIHE